MAEEFLVCGGSWWNSPRNLFSSSPCSLPSNDIGSFGWPTNDVITEMKIRSSDESDGISSSVVIQDAQNSVGISMPTESTLHIIGSLPLSSSAATPSAWINHDFLRESARSEDNYSDFLLDSSMNYRPQINKDWNSNSKNFDDHESFGGDDQPAAVNSTSTSTSTSTSAECGIPMTSQGSDSYSYASSLLHTLFDADSQPQQSLLHQQTTMSSTYSSSSATTANCYQLDSNGFLPSLQPNSNRLWNSTAASFLPSPPSQFLPPSSITNHKPNIHSTRDHKQHEQGKDSAAAVNKASNEPPFKRPRMETPSPLPTFKVRKEKLGDRITALQQLVSPFGKTDTASVLHEAIEYIRFLHNQVNALSTPYLKYGSPPVQRQQGKEKSKDEEGLTNDLKTRGLCLVPISSTFPVAAETTSDFWTPTFGGGSSFR